MENEKKMERMQNQLKFSDELIVEETLNSTVKEEKDISGGINNFRNTDPIIYGYLAEIGNNNPREAVLKIDDCEFEIICDCFRLDLKRYEINEGNHAFEFIVPPNFINGKKHQITLIDKKTGQLICKEEKIWTKKQPDDLKLTLKGHDGFLFLINDSNNEIKQHFDESYENKFKADDFLEDFNYKKKFCYNKNIKYFFFIVPDKSLVCKEFLPFDIKDIKRNYDLISNLVPDFAADLNYMHYFKTDSHINFLGGKELSYRFLNYVNNNFKREHFNKLLNEQIFSTYNYNHPGDLTSNINWSYSEEEKTEYLNEKSIFMGNKYFTNIKKNIPEKFKIVNTRETEFYKNEKGFTDLKVLILRDSSSHLLISLISIYFKEILLYWDHWCFNQELIEWYKPDIILEIRTERFLENMPKMKIK